MSMNDFELHLQQAKRALREAVRVAQTLEELPVAQLYEIDNHLVAALCSASAAHTTYTTSKHYALSARQEVQSEYDRRSH